MSYYDEKLGPIGGHGNRNKAVREKLQAEIKRIESTPRIRGYLDPYVGDNLRVTCKPSPTKLCICDKCVIARTTKK